MKGKKFLQKNADKFARWLMAIGFALTLALGLCGTGGISNQITAYSEEVVASGSCGPAANWTLINGGEGYTLTISGTGEMTDNPWYDEYRENIKTVVIEEGITTICISAFKDCKALTSISIPSTVTSIEDSTFYHCDSLTSIVIPAGVVSIGTEAFYNCGALTTVIFEEDSELISIGTYAFELCTGLNGIEIPSGVTSIGRGAFSTCSGLTDITIPSEVMSIGKGAFSMCFNLTGVTFEAGSKLTSIGEAAFQACNKLTGIEIPASVTSIENNAFFDCRTLTSVTMSCSYIESTTEIFGTNGAITYTYLHGGDEFGYKVNAEDATKHDKVYACCGTIIENTAEDHTGGSYFASGNVLTESCGDCNTELGTATITCAGGLYQEGGYTAVVEGTGSLQDSLQVVYKKQNGEAWDTVTEAKSAGTYRASITLGQEENSATAFVEFTITNPSGTCGENLTWSFDPVTGGLTISGTGAMEFDGSSPWGQYASNIVSVTMEDGITSIADRAFYACLSLASVVIPDSVTSIGSSAFLECRALTTVSIPLGVTSIESSAFCTTGLTAVELPETLKRIEGSAFASTKLTSLVIPEGVEYIGNNSFGMCSSLTTVTIPYSAVNGVKNDAFRSCPLITTVNLPCTWATDANSLWYSAEAVTKSYNQHDGSVGYTYKINAEDATKHDKVYACCETVIENTMESHSQVYSASGNVLTESCGVCSAELGTATITCEGGDYTRIYNEEYGEYEDVSYEAIVTATGTLASEYFSITYKEKAGEEWEEWGGAPCEAGIYQASITLGDGEAAVTAVVDYTINKVDIPEDVTKPELQSSATYNHGYPVVVPCWYLQNYYFEYYFSTSTDGTAWSDWSTERPILTNGGDSLQVKVKMTSNNYNDWTSDAVTVTLQPYEFGVTESDLSVDISDVYYTGTGQMPEFSIYCGGNDRDLLAENAKNGVGCIITYENNVNVSTEYAKAKMIITGDGINYKGTLTGEFAIKQADITEVATTNSGADTAGNPIWVNCATLIAPEGYLIGTEPEGTFEHEFFVWETSATVAGTEVTYYLKQQETGYLSVSKTMTVYVDADSPDMSEYGGDLISTAAEFSWLLTDNMSGVAECRYVFVPAAEVGNVTLEVLMNGTLVSGTDGSYTICVENLTAGAEYALYVLYMDNAGNVSYSGIENITIPKAGYTADTIEKTYYYARENEDGFDVYEYVPSDFGWVEFGITELMEGALFAKEPFVDSQGNVTFTIGAGAVTDAASFKIVIKTDTYEPIYVPVIVTLIDKQPVKLAEDSAVTVTGSITEGAPVSDLTFAEATFLDEEGNVVTGDLSWKNGSATPAAGKVTLTWVFTPADEAYAALEGTVEVTVEAKPTAIPTPTPTAKPTAKPTAIPTPTATAKPTATPTAKPTTTPTLVPTAKPTATPTQVPGTIIVPSTGETVVDTEGKEITAIIQEPGTSNKLVIPGLTDVEQEEGKEPAEVVWESSNPAVVQVDGDGNITMKEPGLAEITVTVGEGEDAKKETIVVLVENPRTYENPIEEAFKDVRLGTSWGDIPLIRYQKLGTVVDINFWGVKNWKQNNYQYIWTSSDETVATVDNKGRVTALKPGIFKLSLGLKNKSTGQNLNVQSVEIVIPKNYEDKILLGTSKNNTFDELTLRLRERIDINFYGVKNWKKEDYEYRWVSSEPTVVWVDKFGRLVPVTPGKADIFLVLVEKKTGYARYVVPVTVTVPEK